MALQSSGAISLNDVAAEFGGSTPHSLSEYYLNGGYTTSNNSGVPSSGTISLSNFYGTTAYVPPPPAIDLTGHIAGTSGTIDLGTTSGWTTRHTILAVTGWPGASLSVSVTLGGISATRVVQAEKVGYTHVSLHYVNSSSLGTSASVVATTSNSSLTNASVYAMYFYDSAGGSTPIIHGSGSDTSSPFSVTLTNPGSGGGVVFVGDDSNFPNIQDPVGVSFDSPLVGIGSYSTYQDVVASASGYNLSGSSTTFTGSSPTTRGIVCGMSIS